MNSPQIRDMVMLSKQEIAVIIALRNQGKSIKAIHRLTGHSRATIRRYIRLEDKVEVQGSLGRPVSAAMEFLTSHEAEIREIFFCCQRHGPVVHRRILERFGQDIPMHTLKRFCKKFRQEYEQANSVEIRPFETQPGVQMQIDFGELDIKVHGQDMRVHFFACILGYSRRIFAKAYSVETTETWLNGLESSFHYFGGRPEQVVSDNAAALVKHSCAHSDEQKFTARYLEFSKYHAIRISATAPGKPRSKGKIERAIRYIKENFFVDVAFDSLEDLNEKLLHWCREVSDNRVLGQPHLTGGKTPRERWLIEQEKFSNRPVVQTDLYLEYQTRRKVDRNGFMRVDNQLYRLPDRCKSQEVTAVITDELIRVMLSGEVVTTLNKATDRYNVIEQPASSPEARLDAYTQRLASLQKDEQWQAYQKTGAILNRDGSVYDKVFGPMQILPR